MSSDRELLEKAAKAAGIELEWIDTLSEDFRSRNVFCYIRRDGPRNKRLSDCVRWSPLTDDGDALRLAVKLDLSIEVHHDLSQPLPWLRIVDREKNWTHAGPGGAHEEDRAASTRRAIVRAAAALADATPSSDGRKA